MSNEAPIQLYFWPTPNGWKITIALEEMGLPYEIRPVNIGKGEQFEPDFLKISPNNRMPAIVDPNGPGGMSISVFESGAILQYLARKSGKFGGKTPHEQAAIEQWVYWQMGGLGPMAGQTHHFRQYAPAVEPDPAKLEYGVKRYTTEVSRLYGVLDRQLAGRDYVAGDYSIADMAIWPWIVPHNMQGQSLDDFPQVKRWFEAMGARPAVVKGFAVGKDLSLPGGGLGDKSKEAEEARKILFGQGAKPG